MGGIMALVLGLSAFAFYLFGVYPSVSVGDAGEFITAAWTLGIPHAPGFPVYSLLGHLFGFLEPWGNPGYRLNLFSATVAGLAIGLFYRSLIRLAVNRFIATGCALILAMSGAWAANARASEVFALNALFFVLVLQAIQERHWIMAFFLIGLGAGNHQIILFLLPVLMIILYRDPSLSLQKKITSAAFLFAGLLVYVGLLCRAGEHPFLDVGTPDSWERLWRVVSRADYGSLTLALGAMPVRDAFNTWLQIGRCLKGVSLQITPLLVIAAFGSVLAWRSKKSVRPIALSFLFLGPCFFVMGNLPFDAQSNGLLIRFLIAPTLAIAMLSAIGLQTLFEKNRTLTLIALFLTLGWQTAQADWSGFREDFTAYDYGRNNLHTLPLQARFIMDGGDDTFYILSYLTQVEGRRKDLVMHDRGGVVFAHPYGPDFRRLMHDQKEERRQRIEQALALTDQPLYYSTMNPELLHGHPLEQEGLLYRPEKKSIKPKNNWEFYVYRGVSPWDQSDATASKDYRTRALLPFYAYQKGIALGKSGDLPRAWMFLKCAQALGPDVLWLIPNIVSTIHVWAYAAFIHQQNDLSMAMYQWILKLAPQDSAAQQNLRYIETHRAALHE